MSAAPSRRDVLATTVGASLAVAAAISIPCATAAHASSFDPVRWSCELHAAGGGFTWDHEADKAWVFFPISPNHDGERKDTLRRLNAESIAHRAEIAAFIEGTA